MSEPGVPVPHRGDRAVLHVRHGLPVRPGEPDRARMGLHHPPQRVLGQLLQRLAGPVAVLAPRRPARRSASRRGRPSGRAATASAVSRQRSSGLVMIASRGSAASRAASARGLRPAPLVQRDAGGPPGQDVARSRRSGRAGPAEPVVTCPTLAGPGGAPAALTGADDEHRGAEHHVITGLDRHRLADSPAVHPGAVGGPERRSSTQPSARRSSRACQRDTEVCSMSRSHEASRPMVKLVACPGPVAGIQRAGQARRPEWRPRTEPGAGADQAVRAARAAARAAGRARPPAAHRAAGPARPSRGGCCPGGAGR